MTKTLTTKFYLEKVKEITPRWNITITPDDLFENAAKYHRVKIKVENTKVGIIRECDIPLNALPDHKEFPALSWWRSGLISSNIASLVSIHTPIDPNDLDDKIINHLSEFYTESEKTSGDHKGTKPERHVPRISDT